jgi:hypothetical protein
MISHSMVVVQSTIRLVVLCWIAVAAVDESLMAGTLIDDETPADFGDDAFHQQSANTTIRTQISAINPSEFPAGSFFPNFIVQEQSRWPNPQWPRSTAGSRRILTERALEHMAGGAILILFSAADCPRCAEVLGLCGELGIPAAHVNYDAAAAGIAPGAAAAPRPGAADLRRALRQLDCSHREPYVFLGSRFLGDPDELLLMHSTGELHGRLRGYGAAPRAAPPVNRAPLLRVQPRATRPEAERAGAPWESGWAHPAVTGVLHLTLVEADGLARTGITIDPGAAAAAPGAAAAAAAPPRPNVSASCDAFAVAAIGGLRAQTPVRFRTAAPRWAAAFALAPVARAQALLTVSVYQADPALAAAGPAADPARGGAVAPALLGAAAMVPPLAGRVSDRWYALAGRAAGERVAGRVRVRMRYEAVYAVQARRPPRGVSLSLSLSLSAWRLSLSLSLRHY